MCGIAGFINLDRSPVDRRVLERMAGLIRHRGPDDSGSNVCMVDAPSVPFEDGVAGDAAVGFHRLKILDLTEHGHQPMLNADRTVMLAFNGEIYNAFDFTAELTAAGFRFRGRSDTEVVLYLYERYGLDGMLERLNGMFAIVIVDLRTHDVHIIRDHLGIKPIYWTVAGGALLFASEAKAFLAHPAFRAEIDESHLDEYLTFRYVSGAESLLKGVNQLRPGHRLLLRQGAISLHRYWDIPDQPDKAPLTRTQAVDQLDGLLQRSVKSQLLSDVKVGCQLSGGIDSSLVSVLARARCGADLETFSVVFDDPRYSEDQWATEAAASARADSHRYTFSEQFFFETLDKASWHMDQPISHPNSLGIWLLAQGARRHVTVLLSGEGADEVFAGYTRFHYAHFRRRLSPLVPVVRWMPGLGPRIARQFGGDPVGTFILSSSFQRHHQLSLIRPQADPSRAMDRRRLLFHEGHGDHLSNCLKYEMQTYLTDLLVRQDKMTMAHGVENRVPFLDRQVVDFARTLPARHLVGSLPAVRNNRMRGTKVVVKQLARRFFGDPFVYRRKSGFSLPLGKYFSSARGRTLMEEQVLPGIRQRGLLDERGVRQMWQTLPQAAPGTDEALWVSVAFELWAQQTIDGDGAR